MERKLAAILAADVAGYSRLMRADEEGTLNALRAHREVVDGFVGAHRGRVFNSAGDSVVAEFPSAVEAINCAVEIQQEMAQRNEAVPRDRRLELRVGLNIGDVMVDGGNLFGDGVNVAARLQERAERGGICVARNVYNQVRHKVGVAFEPLGEQHVKNIAEPVTAYRVVIEGGAATPGRFKRLRAPLRWWRAAAVLALLLAAVGAGTLWHAARPTGPPCTTPECKLGVPAVLVLPFQNLTGDPALDIVGRAIGEDLRDLLWNFPEFQVVSSTSSDASQASPSSIKALAQQFGAELVIEGSVRRAGATTVITAQLIDATTDTHLRSDRFEESISDPVELEQAIATKLAEKFGGVTGEMRKAYERLVWAKAESGLTEYDYYVRGHTHHLRTTPEDAARARDIYLAGLDRYPESGLLHIKLAFVHIQIAWNGWSEDSNANLTQVREHTAKAAELLAARRPSRFEEWYLHWASHYRYWLERDYDRCMAEARAAVTLAPYDALLRADLADGLARCGDPTEAIAWVKESIRLEAEGALGWYRLTLAWVSYLAGQYQDAASVIEGMNEADRPLLIWAACHVELGQLGQARSIMAAFTQGHPDWSLKKEAAAPFPMVDSLRRRWLDDLRMAGLPDG